jgi:hypothetical protein
MTVSSNFQNPAAELGAHLAEILGQLKRLPGYAPLDRIAVALYDERTDLLFSCAHAGHGAMLESHECELSEVPSLAILATGEEPRVVDDLGRYGFDGAIHTAALRYAGFRSSLTFPVQQEGRLAAFIFYNALKSGFFTPAVVRVLAGFSTELVELVRRYSRKH